MFFLSRKNIGASGHGTVTVNLGFVGVASESE